MIDSFPVTSHAPRLQPPRRQEWMDAALCTQVDPTLFFPDGPSAHFTKTADTAKSVCRACTVMSECLAYALEHDERYGIWGGADPVERSLMRRRQA